MTGGRIADRLGWYVPSRLAGSSPCPRCLRCACARIRPPRWHWRRSPGLQVNLPFAVLVKLGQDYLPTRPGTASGVTLGLGVSAGGLFVPILGMIADHHGPQAVLTVLCFIPISVLILGMLLPTPDLHILAESVPDATGTAERADESVLAECGRG